MFRTFALASIVILFAAAFAGCLNTDQRITDYHAAGQEAFFALGDMYDGRGVESFANGVITVHANDKENTGIVHAVGTVAGKVWDVTFDQFHEAPGKPFQDGGIAGDLHEHGATGQGDKRLPRVHVDMAGWGEARVTVNGQPLKDEITGDETWLAHFMVLTTGVRNDTDHGIWKDQNKSAPYDPATPDEGWADPNDAEIHLQLKNHTGIANGTSVNLMGSPAQTNPSYSDSKTFANPYRGSIATLTAQVDATPSVQATNVTLTIKDPAGLTVASVNLGSKPGASDSKPLPVLTLQERGDYKVEVQGAMVNAQWKLTGPIQAPAQIVLNFWFEKVVFGSEAEALETMSHSPPPPSPPPPTGPGTRAPSALFGFANGDGKTEDSAKRS